MRSIESTNKMASNESQLKLTIRNVLTTFQCEFWNYNKNVDVGAEGDVGRALETYKFFGA